MLADCAALGPGCRGTRSLTVAVESGSERVRQIVNKKLATEEIARCAQAAQVHGWWAGVCGRPAWRAGELCIWMRWPSGRPTRAADWLAPTRSGRLQEGGLEGLKLYGMVGVPGEQDEGGWTAAAGGGGTPLHSTTSALEAHTPCPTPPPRLCRCRRHDRHDAAAQEGGAGAAADAGLLHVCAQGPHALPVVWRQRR